MLRIGHRGAMGHAPENTLLSFKKAIPFVDMIEIDVHTCLSGDVVVFHDYDLERCTNGKGLVAETHFKILKQLNAGLGQSIPSLEETLDFIDNQVAINIELKGGNTAKPVARIIETYLKNQKYTSDRFLVSSFNHLALQEFHRLLPTIDLGCLIGCVPAKLADIATDIPAQYLNIADECVDIRLLKDAHQKGLKVLVYTVNDKDRIQYLKALGVDGIFSNYPERLA